MHLRRSELFGPELRQFPFVDWGQCMVVRAATAACFFGSRGELGNVGRNIKLRDVDDLVLGLGSVRVMPKHRQKNHENKNTADNGKGQHLADDEVFILRPDIANLDGLAGEIRGWQLGRKEKFFQPSTEAAEIASPGNR